MAIAPYTVVGPSPLPAPGLSPSAPAPAAGAQFGQLFGQLLGAANAQQAQADGAVLDLATGQTSNIHDVTLAVAKADLMFRLVLEIRNRLTEAYQEIQRMQI